MNELSLLYMCDDAFATMAGVSLTSLFENNPKDKIILHVYLLLVRVSEENRRRFKKLAEKYGQDIYMIEAEETMKEVMSLDVATYRGSAMTNLRLYFDRLVPENVHRLLYVDCDTIICSTLQELCMFDMQNRTLGMVLDAYGALMRTPELGNAPYYNAGILLIDCDKWRGGNWSSRITGYIKEHGAQFKHPDQDIYNIVCRDEIVCMPIRYNFQTMHRAYGEKLYFRWFPSSGYYEASEIAEARNNPAIVHMIRMLGINPWSSGAWHPDREIFNRYKEKSFWRSEPELPDRADGFIRIERILYRILPNSLFFPLSLVAIKVIQNVDKKNRY